MSINPNLILQLLITIASLAREYQRRDIGLEDKTQEQLKKLLQDIDAEMMDQPDLKERR